MYRTPNAKRAHSEGAGGISQCSLAGPRNTLAGTPVLTTAAVNDDYGLPYTHGGARQSTLCVLGIDDVALGGELPL